MTEKVNEKLKKKNDWARYAKIGLTAFLTVAACILFFFAIYRYDEIAKEWSKLMKAAEPIFFGLILAYLLMPVRNFIEPRVYKLLEGKMKKKESAKNWSQRIGIMGCILFLFGIIAILLSIIVPAVVTSIVGLVENMQDYAISFFHWVTEMEIENYIPDAEIRAEIKEYILELMEWAKTEVWPKIQAYLAEFQKYILQITSGVVSTLKTMVNFIIGIIVMVYVMSIRDQLIGQSKKITYAVFSVKRANVIIETARKSHEIFSGFIIGKIIDSAIIGVICYAGCLVLRIPSSLLVAVVVGVTNIIPFFGPFVGAFVTVPLVLIQSPIHALYLAIFILVLQQVDGNIIGPKILGDTTGLSSFWVMFSILVAGGVFGFGGMLLGVPTFAVIYYITQRFVKTRMEKRKLPTTTKSYVDLLSIDENTMEMKYGSTEESKEEEKEA